MNPAAAAHAPRMPLLAALEVLVRLRRDEIVITSMGTAREWPKLASHPLDFHYVPSAMGQAPALGLGLALARPDRQVIALSGDGSLLMNLGVLVTIAAAGAKNLTTILFDNGVYEVTGGQATAGARARVDFVGLARAAGMASVERFAELAAWQAGAAAALALPGPRLIVLEVAPMEGDTHLDSPGPMAERIARFRAALGAGGGALG